MPESTTARLLKQIKEVCELAGAKTEEYARISRKRLDVVSLGREIQKEKAALGERVYDLAREETEAPVLEDSTVRAAIDRLRNLEQSLQSCEEEISEIRDATRERMADVRRRYATAAEAEASPEPPGEAAPKPPADAATRKSTAAPAMAEDTPESEAGEPTP